MVLISRALTSLDLQASREEVARNRALASIAFLVVTALTLSTTSGGASPVVLPYGLWVMGSDGTDAQRLIRYTSFDAQIPQWSPDGSRLAIEKAGRILVVDVNTATRKSLTEDGYNFDPTWAPDGTQIAIATSRDGARTDIYIVASDGTGEVQLTTDSRRDESPKWAPDGQAIAFTRHGNGGGLFTIDVRSGQETRLVGGVYGELAWSPSGDQILFTSAEDVWLVNADGSAVANLTHSDAWESNPVWAPEGAEIAYCRGRSIFMIGVDGTDRRRIMKGTDCFYGLSWSPEGTRLAFVNDGDIWSMRPGGSGARRLTRTRPLEASPAWSPGGSHIAYLR